MIHQHFHQYNNYIFSFCTEINTKKIIFLLCLLVENTNLIYSKICFPLIFDSIEKKSIQKLILMEILISETVGHRIISNTN